LSKVSASHRLLLGTAGTGTTWGILASLREKWGGRVWVLAADMARRELIPASTVADQFARIPAIDAKDFATVVLELLSEYSIDTYLPTYDPEIVLAASLREQAKIAPGVLLAPPLWSAELCWDKLEASRWLREHSFPSPATARLDQASWNGKGLFVKPRQGVGSTRTATIESSSDLDQLRQDLTAEEFIAQERLQGPELTLDCFLDPSGAGRVICRERLEVKSGVCTKARVFEDPELSALALAVGQGMEFRGSYCLQAIQNDAREWLISDINPRTGAGTRISAAVGVDFAAANLALAWGEEPYRYLGALDKEHWVARQYREIIVA
jgi:carbamoylphosphate synthase large subunit